MLNTHKLIWNRGWVRVAAMMAIATAASTPGLAQTYLPASGTDDWNVDANWSTLAFPNGAGLIATFDAATGDRVVNLGQTITIGTLNLNNDASDFGTTIGGGADNLIFRQNLLGTGTATINNNGTGAAANVISAGVIQTAPMMDVFQNSTTGTLEIADPLGLQISKTMNKRGAGTLILSGDNTDGGLVGKINLLEGTLRISDGDSLGNASLNFVGGTLRVIGDGSTDVDGVDTEFQQTALVDVASITDFTLGDTVDGIGGTGGVTKTGTGKLNLPGFNSYTGTVTLSQGELVIDNLHPVGVEQGLGAGATPVVLGTGADAVTLKLDVTPGSNTTDRGFTLNGSNDATIFVQSNPVTLDGDISTNGNPLIFDGAFNVLSNTTVNGSISGNGSVAKAGPHTVIFAGNNTYSGATAVKDGTLQIDGTLSGGTVTVHDGAKLSGSGSIGGAVNVRDGGTIAPGSSAGELTVDSLTMQSDATLNIQIGGATPVTEHDVLNVTKTASLDGTFDVRLSGGFMPDIGDTFTVLTADNITGGFAAESLPFLENGLGWMVNVNAADITLEVFQAFLPGDANNDGQVTGADLISVQQNFGSVGPLPLQGDANHDSRVTGADLISVQQNFGNVFSPSGVASVPEPATLAMLGLLGVVISRRRRASRRSTVRP